MTGADHGGPQGGRRGRKAGPAAAVVAAAAGLALLGFGVAGQQEPPAAATQESGRVATAPEGTAGAKQTAPPVPRPSQLPTTPRVAPATIAIPRIGVTSAVVALGENPDRSIQVPGSADVAGWYTSSVSPGEVGPSVFLGHVDSDHGPGVFFRLAALRPGDVVTLPRTDGRTVTYRITDVGTYPQDDFPTLKVYADTPVPTIRLITCGGQYNHTERHYESNVVAFGELAG